MVKSDIGYALQENGSFVIDNYNDARPFSSFFPGIAGLFGIPLWAFYVNRGQCISSVGVRSKDEAIFEFLPANKAYQLTSTQGFRTFIKIKNKKDFAYYEPFARAANRMIIRPYELSIEEENIPLGLKVAVNYFPIPNAPYAALVRELVIENISKKSIDIEFLDGASVILPAGINNFFLKEMSRTIEAWMVVNGAPQGLALYKLTTDPRDTAQVAFVEGANFYTGFEEGKTVASTKIIVDPSEIFGQSMDLISPLNFFKNSSFVYPKNNIAQNKTPCGFSFVKARLSCGERKRFTSMIGHMFESGNVAKYNFGKLDSEFIALKKNENKELIDGIMDRIFTVSGSSVFDMYARQTYLDNVLRGGLPYSVEANNCKRSIYVYSRKHGDLERDYNRFLVEPSYFSQGEGNYRDVNQNRRCDVFFNPLVGEKNVVDFINLIQLDGYNPLIFKGEKFILSQDIFDNNGFAKIFLAQDIQKISRILSKPFSLGEILRYLDKNKVKLSCSCEDLIKKLLCFAVATQEATHGEGFWSDHWTYNTDLLESFNGMFPDKMKWLLFEKNDFTYFDTHVFVKPRSARYSLVNGEVRQYHGVFADEAKNVVIQKRQDDKHRVRIEGGKGCILKSSLMAKLACLMVNKFTTLDPYGVGIEMEADKPNWYDALNGLPGLLGSSISETFELKRLMMFLKDIFDSLEVSEIQEVVLFSELAEFLKAVVDLLKEDVGAFDFWDRANSLKEAYRLSVCYGVSGQAQKVSITAIEEFLDLALKKMDVGIKTSFDKSTGCYPTYFSYRVLKHETIADKSGKHSIVPKSFEQKRLPLFLEGFVHALRTEKQKARAIFRAVKKSVLFDKKLKMYKVNASLSDESFEIGRCKAFTPGWLENESIWLHMEYKFILELLKNGLFDEFYEEFFNTLVPFQKPQVYGRSILENSSFIASSAHPDKTLHGGGFVARLSGSTAEFIHIWLLMNIGEKPFFLSKDKKLALRFNPVLPSKLFSKQKISRNFILESGESFLTNIAANSYSFLFLGSVLVTYINPKRKNTFGESGVKPISITLFDKNKVIITVKGDVLYSLYADMVREKKIDRIEVALG